jgi:hypothetical protein
MERVFVRPGVGPDGERYVSRNPATGKPLSVDGEWVDRDRTTRRRLADGDWEEGNPPADRPPTESTATPPVIETPFNEQERR